MNAFAIFPIPLSTQVVVTVRRNLLLRHNQSQRRLKILNRLSCPQLPQILSNFSVGMWDVTVFRAKFRLVSVAAAQRPALRP